MTRFKFLVLVGDSKYGKPRFACNLWGVRNTYVAQCLGLTQPDFSGYDPRVHQAIVFDEPSRSMVDEGCKVLLQASVEGPQLYQSPTQRFTRWIWVYQVPMIVCTNKWLSPWEWGANARWIHENSVQIDVADYLYKKE